MEKNIETILSQMTLKEKASLCSGQDFWRTKPIKRLGIPSIMMADGPHGLRVEAGGGDHMTKGGSIPATCFPTAAATACSWDRDLLREIGRALGGEALERGVSVLLGPGANIKRSPLCGRNFEYFSEDPVLAGEMAAAWIEGVQAMGVGVSLKHFAVNNQEHRRMTVDAVVDGRALQEIYLAGFEAAVKRAKPWTVMCAYNRLNGEFCSENAWLLTDVLRREWGFGGAVVTDWGACNDRVRGLASGQDIEMPGSGGVNDKRIVQAVKSGRLPMKVLDEAVGRLLELIQKGDANRKPGYRCDMEGHHALARRAAAESAALLKNDGGVLPLRPNAHIAVIGALAVSPRYQGCGSSLINPWRLETAREEMARTAADLTYAPGYRLDSDKPDEALIAEACAAARAADVAVVFAGLTEEYESEGFDREHMRMPESHNELIRQVAEANPDTVVVLAKGSPVEMPWLGAVKAVLDGYLGGQAGAGGAVDVLFGRVNPSGRLAETVPVRLEDGLSSRYFPMGPDAVEYRESLYVGYRWFDSAKLPVLFPFGHGLSYTTFEYSKLELDRACVPAGGQLGVRLTVRNTGGVAGATVVQVYVRAAEATAFRPEKELKGFEKVFLEPGEEKQVSIALEPRTFAYYDTRSNGWLAEGGEYEVLVGASSADIRLRAPVRVEGEQPGPRGNSLRGEGVSPYCEPARLLDGISDKDFEGLIGRAISREGAVSKRFTLNSTLGDVRGTLAGKALNALIRSIAGRAMGADDSELGRRMLAGMIGDLPLRNLVTMSGGWFPAWFVRFLLAVMNIGR